MDKNKLKLLKIDLGVIREILIEEGKYHLYKNKTFKSKKTYNRKQKHKHKKTSDE